mmetsp:Transcript_26696/g.36850  ORF Transcript_26696/g.36850 Transcript_26696/m.36850 type:complete len:240 (-) Transcript_26696:1687-2406(-)
MFRFGGLVFFESVHCQDLLTPIHFQQLLLCLHCEGQCELQQREDQSELAGLGLLTLVALEPVHELTNHRAELLNSNSVLLLQHKNLRNTRILQMFRQTLNLAEHGCHGECDIRGLAEAPLKTLEAGHGVECALADALRAHLQQRLGVCHPRQHVPPQRYNLNVSGQLSTHLLPHCLRDDSLTSVHTPDNCLGELQPSARILRLGALKVVGSLLACSSLLNWCHWIGNVSERLHTAHATP